MSDNVETLSERDSLLAGLLSRGMSLSKAARLGGCSRTVVSRLWNHDQNFRREVRRLCLDRAERGERRIAGLMRSAVDELTTLLNDENPAVRLRAIQLVVSRCGAMADSRIRDDLDELLRWRNEATDTNLQ